MAYTIASKESLEERQKGIPKEKPMWFRILVLAIFLGSLSMCIKQTYDLVLIYLSDPIVTQIKMSMHDVMQFPAVTVCNMNPVRRSRWEKKIKELAANAASELHSQNRSRRAILENFAPNIDLFLRQVEKITNKLDSRRREVRETNHRKRRGLAESLNEVQNLANENTNKIAALQSLTDQMEASQNNEGNAELNKIQDDMAELSGSIDKTEASFASLNTTIELLRTKMNDLESTTVQFFQEMERTKSYLKSLQANMTKFVNTEKNATTTTGQGEQELPPSKDMEAFNDYLKNIGRMNRSDIYNVGYQIEDFIAICLWQGSICNPNHFGAFQNIVYGNCFTFNTSQVDSAVKGAGPRNGLSLSLYIEQNEYIDRVAPAAGARVVIHDLNRRPFPEDEGFSVAPGYTSAVFLRKSTTETVEPMCDPDVPSSYEHNGKKFEYSEKACLRRCLSDEIIRQCGCAGITFLLDTNHTCSLENKDEEQCVKRLESLAQKKQLPCVCPVSCRSTTYNPMISSAIWPAEKYLPSFLEELVRVRHNVLYLLGNVTDISSYFRKHFLRIDIFFQELTEQEIIQRHSYGVESLLSDIGGQLGLWIGVSVSTLYQSVETVYVVIVAMYRWLKNRRPRSPRVATSPESAEEVPI